MLQPIPTIESIEQPVSLKTHVLKAVREAIITHRLKPGEFYGEVSLAEELGVSRTPVREALISLEAQRFITIVRGRGFQINAWDPLTVSEIYLYRKMLEMTIIRIAAPKMDESTIDRLKGIHVRETTALRDGNVRAHQRADRAIHLLLAEQTENSYLYNSMESIRDKVEWVGYGYLATRPHVLKKFSQEHIELTEALRIQDVDAAETIMSQHIDRGEKEILKAFTPSEDP